MTNDTLAVEYVAEIRQVKSMVDKTINVTINLPEYCQEQAAQMMRWQGQMIRVVAEVQPDNAGNRQKSTKISRF